MLDMLLRIFVAYVSLTIRYIDGGSDYSTSLHDHRRNYQDFEVVHPIRLDPNGNFMSHNLHFVTHTNRRKKRDVGKTRSEYGEERVLYSLPLKGKQMTLNLTKNEVLVPSNFLIERFENHHSVKQTFASSFSSGTKRPCHFRGHVAGHPDSKVALSTCHGLTGFISTADGDFLLEPLEAQSDNSDDRSQPHKIYRQDVSTFLDKAEPMLDVRKSKRKTNTVPKPKEEAATPTQESPMSSELSKDYCGVLDTKKRYRRIVSKRDRWESRHGQARRHRGTKFDNPASKRRSKRSVSEERLIEMLVVADKTMVDFYNANDHGGVEKYVLTIVNMVSELFKDASIGNSIQVSLVRLILLENEKDGPEITTHAENTLDKFCKWAKTINPKGDDHPNHHDVAVLLTKRDICSDSNTSCETLGLAHVAGMCQTHRSCSLNQDTGLSVAYTIAHELGHNFAMHHDGQINDCKPSSKYNYLMAPHLMSSKLPMKWSSCSRRYITRFLDRNWGYCLNDKPTPHPEYQSTFALPGSVYNADHQCRLMFGVKSRYCAGVGDMCNRLWCYVGDTCRSRLHAAATGTKCGRRKWCLGGKCVSMRKHPKKIDGGWGEWSKWTICSRTCGIGVKSSSRQCDNPVPRNGGSFCVGERKRYKTCSVWRCPVNVEDGRSFRAQQCAQFNHIRYRNRTLSWLPVESAVYPCELHCSARTGKAYFADRLRSKVIDGTKCFSGSDDICVDGICRRLGCDKNVGSRALEDRCGVCHGNGSACYEVDTVFKQRKGEEYTAANLLPVGARNVEIIEVEPVANFLALRHPTNLSQFYLNGNYMIQWDTKFQLAGTQFAYRRINETQDLITAPGPLTENVMLMVLFVKENPGVSIKYTAPYDVNFDPDPELDLPVFGWRIEGWSECSQLCGKGSQYLQIACHERHTGVVEEFHCNATERPANERRTCNESPCPAKWSTSPWGSCSVTCGNKRGLQHRTIACERLVENGNIKNLEKTKCKGLDRPAAKRKCHSKIQAPCPIWRTGNWQQCTQTCGAASVRNRTVQCITFIEEDIINLHGEDEIVIETIDVPDVEIMRKYKRSVRSRRSVAMKAIDFDPEVDGYEVDDDFCNIKTKPRSLKHCKLHPCPVRHTTASMSTPASQNGSSTIPSATYGDPTPSALIQESSRATITQEQKSTYLPTFDIALEVHKTHISHVHTTMASTRNYPSQNSSVSMNDEKDDVASTPTISPQLSKDDFSVVTETNLFDVGIETITKQHEISDNNQEIAETDERAPTSGTNETALPSHISPVEITAKPIPLPEASSTTHNSILLSHQATGEPTSSNQHPTPYVGDEFDIIDESNNMGDKPAPQIVVVPLFRKVADTFDITDAPATTSSPSSKVMTIPVSQKSANPNLSRGDTTRATPGEWLFSDWGECSVTCGVGARIRRVHCSLLDEKLCNKIDKPAPAMICHMGPCAKWTYGEWTKCSTQCGNGIRSLRVECVDEWTKKILRPHHCSRFQQLPPVNVSCHSNNCLSWRMSRWNSCSKPCGAGIQRRRVVCPKTGQCDAKLKPVHEKSCLARICVDWKPLSWNKCSVHCGGGIRRRDIICVERETRIMTNSTLCPPGLKPNRYERCNQGQCPVTDYDFANCHADRLSPGFCGLLQKLGRCVQPSLAIQCCVTCKTYLSVRQKDKIS